ncbi:MAG TPA: OmpA family protein [Alphaproteobacteria bacterium]|nr:OmpA family protein [Alphaproteobacteria bacterium]
MKLQNLFCLGVMALTLSACASDLFVVLPHEDGSVGSVVVRQNGNDTVLDKANSAVKGGDSQAFTLASADVDQRFGHVLTQLPPAARSYILYFKEGTTILEPASAPVMEDMRKDVAARTAGEIMVIGHTDRVGNLNNNDLLAYSRALSISDVLIESGIPRDTVIVAGRGEREPLVPTDDEVEEPRNRRVEISVR